MATSANRFEHRTNAIDRMGRTVVYEGELLRHPVYTRFLHWMVGIFFFLALLSGFGIYLPWIFRFFTPLFGGGAMTRFLHPWFGLGFVIFFGCVAYVITGFIMWFPEIFGRMLVAISYVIHDLSALVMLFGIFFHIYLSTFGEPGTIQSMTR